MSHFFGENKSDCITTLYQELPWSTIGQLLRSQLKLFWGIESPFHQSQTTVSSIRGSAPPSDIFFHS